MSKPYLISAGYFDVKRLKRSVFGLGSRLNRNGDWGLIGSRSPDIASQRLIAQAIMRDVNGSGISTSRIASPVWYDVSRSVVLGFRFQ